MLGGNTGHQSLLQNAGRLHCISSLSIINIWAVSCDQRMSTAACIVPAVILQIHQRSRYQRNIVMNRCGSLLDATLNSFCVHVVCNSPASLVVVQYNA